MAADLPERRAPTHTLVVEIPLHFEAHKSAGLGAPPQDAETPEPAPG